MALSQYGVVGNLVGFTTFYSDSARPEDIVNAVAKKDIDVAIVWGPLAGYFVRSSSAPLAVQPLPERDSLSDFPFQYNIGMAVRRRDRALRDSLQATLDRRRPEIQGILKQFGVPVLPIKEEKDDDDDGSKATAPARSSPADSARASKP
jgi:ABC-type amino acid transport substrate-binding protein